MKFLEDIIGFFYRVYNLKSYFKRRFGIIQSGNNKNSFDKSNKMILKNE